MRLWRHRRPPAATSAGAREITLTTDDGVTLLGLVLPGPRPAGRGEGPGQPAGPAVVIAHGLTNSTAFPATRRVINRVARHSAVVAIDLRGHGRSGGLSSVGRDEYHDIDAAVRFARAHGHTPVTTLGFSLGASVVLRHGAVGSDPADGVVAVSAPSRWYIRDTGPMRRVHWMLEHPAGAPVGRLVGVRLGPGWEEVPLSPVESIGHIATPLLLVHGTADHYFGPTHALTLQEAAPQARLWIEPGMGHAESGASPDLIDRICRWIAREVDDDPSEHVRADGPG